MSRQPTHSAKPIILCDIDGTLALRGDRAPHDHDTSMEDAVNWPVARLCDALHASGVFEVLLISGREERCRDVTEYWLATHRLLSYRLGLLMRPLGNVRPDDIVKRELFHQHILPQYVVHAALDDRNKVVRMWRALGLTCLQVAEGDF